MANKKISYTVKDFEAIRTELINYTKTYYPTVVQNFNDASIFSVMMDLNAAVTDNLYYNIDRSIQETVLQYAQQRSSIYNIARTYGLKIPNVRPSVAILDISITVPALGDQEDLRYCGFLRRGAQFIGGGQVFETVDDVDFSSPFNSLGRPNRLKIPNFDNNNNLINYTITKRETVVNGTTKVFRKTVNAQDARPFLEVFLPEQNVLSITSVILKDGTNYNGIPSYDDFLSPANKWYEVNSLAEDRVFIEDPTKVSDKPGVKVGKYIITNSRFVSEYTPLGYCKMTFGGGNTSADDLLRDFARNGTPLDLSRYQNNFGLGSTLKANSTLFIQYRIGGGSGSNLGVNVINQIGTVTFFVNGPNQIINTNVVNSLSCNNVTAAIGGADAPSIEEVRNYVSFNFAAQQRAVTINDYQSLINTMPSKFGAPGKVAIVEEENKIKIKILSYDNNGTLTSSISNTIQENIANYLSNYRMLNDYISIESAQVVDLAFQISVVLDSSQNQGNVISSIVNIVSTYMSPANIEMGENIYISEIKRQIQSLNGVISITDVAVFNKVGGEYSSNQTSMSYSNSNTKQISLVDDTLFAEPSQIYQVRFPNRDITVQVKNFQTVNFS
jgi:hypothetical protein